jgi:hypothetical protein
MRKPRWGVPGRATPSNGWTRPIYRSTHQRPRTEDYPYKHCCGRLAYVEWALGDPAPSRTRWNGKLNYMLRKPTNLLGLQASRHPFITHPLWHSLEALDHNAKTARVVNDRDLRRRLVEDRPDDDYTRGMATILERTFELGEPLNYEPDFANMHRQPGSRSRPRPLRSRPGIAPTKGWHDTVAAHLRKLLGRRSQRRLPDAREPQHGLRYR